MKKVYVSGTNVITSLGSTVRENFFQVALGNTGIQFYQDHPYSPDPFFASLIPSTGNELKVSSDEIAGPYTRLESLCIRSILDALKNTAVSLEHADTLLILSTTKGNIDVLDKSANTSFSPERAYLNEFGNAIGRFFKAANAPLVVCNACISGVLALINASRQIRSGKYKTIIVCGGDLISSFTVAGFQAFKAFGTTPCRPYDEKRDGLSLGEGAGTVILTADEGLVNLDIKVTIGGGSTSNDANHISGPSRSGDGLAAAIQNAMKESGLVPQQIDYISAHGTATMYNDEMECKAMHLCGLDAANLNSFKGAIGHTLGAAGVIEVALAIESMQKETLLASVGFSNPGVTLPLNVIQESKNAAVNHILKTASGFGGCNSALILSKLND